MTFLKKKNSKMVNTSSNKEKAATSFTLCWKGTWLLKRKRLKTNSQEWFTSTSKATTLGSWLCFMTSADRPALRQCKDAEWPQSTETVSRECWAASKIFWKETKNDITPFNKKSHVLDFLCYYFLINFFGFKTLFFALIFFVILPWI